jgi:porphobilinogen deaminase
MDAWGASESSCSGAHDAMLIRNGIAKTQRLDASRKVIDEVEIKKEPDAGGGCIGLLIRIGNWEEEECCQSLKERWEEECAAFERLDITLELP